MVIYHYAVVDTSKNLNKYAKHLQKYDHDVSELCRDRLRPAFNK